MNRQFPALRGLAIILVVLNHTTTLGTQYPQLWGYPPPPEWLNFIILTLNQLGVFAVPIFLFLSGCFFAYAIQNKNMRQSYKTVGSGLKNILWPYLFWSIIFYIEIFFLHKQTYTFLGYVKNLIVGYPLNFVPLLIVYYLVSPLLVRFCKRYALIVILIIGVYQLFLINLVNPGVLGFTFPGWARFLKFPILSVTLSDWAIFFPLGIIYSIHMKSVIPYLRKFQWILIGLTGVFFALTVLNFAIFIYFPSAKWIAPILFIALIPLIKRESIPIVRQFEKVGKRAYGLYLINLTVMDLTLYAIRGLTPRMLGVPLILLPVIFVIALWAPLLLMNAMERLPNHGVYRYVFG
jgi:peptidoglycan/LPS O-acetylase OafA/YrhL